MDLQEAKTLLAALQRERVEYVLVGSMGMAAQGLVRATHDLDFFVSPGLHGRGLAPAALRAGGRLMPVRKYRSVADMPGPPPLPPLDPGNLRRAFELSQLTAWLCPTRHEPGVRKFRSAEEANRHREASEAEQLRLRMEDPSRHFRDTFRI